MEIKTSVRKDYIPPSSTGLLVGLKNPPERLADQYQSILGLHERPQHVLLGIPAQSIQETELDKALTKTAVKMFKMGTKSFVSRSSVPPLVKLAVNAGWLAVDGYGLFQNYKDPNRNIPALIVQTTGVALKAASLGSEATGIGEEFFDNVELQGNMGTALTVFGAAANGRDISLAVMNADIMGTETGKILGLAAPIVEAAINEDLKYGQVKLGPLPKFLLPKTDPLLGVGRVLTPKKAKMSRKEREAQKWVESLSAKDES